MTQLDRRITVGIPIFFGVLVVGIVVRFLIPAWPFTRIGALAGLVALIALIAKDFLEWCGGPGKGNPKANTWARNLAPFIYFLFVPITVIAGWYQFVATPPAEMQSDARIKPEDFIENHPYFWVKEDWHTDNKALLAYLKQTEDRLKALETPSSELLVLNCGADPKAACACPADYPNEVEYRPATDTNWNLNANIKGPKDVAVISDAIKLCTSRSVRTAGTATGSE